jgi:hypothetical protein
VGCWTNYKSDISERLVLKEIRGSRNQVRVGGRKLLFSRSQVVVMMFMMTMMPVNDGSHWIHHLE